MFWKSRTLTEKIYRSTPANTGEITNWENRTFPSFSGFHSDINHRDVLFSVSVGDMCRGAWQPDPDAEVSTCKRPCLTCVTHHSLGLQLKRDETGPKKKRRTARCLNRSYNRSHINHPLCRSETLAGVRRYLRLPFGRVSMWPYVLAYIKTTSVS